MLSIKRVLVVGSWAKEQITIENIKQNPDFEVYVYMDTKNPGIIDLVDGYKIGDFHNVKDVISYVKKQNIDLVLITTAEPLSLGLVDELEKENILVFGPNKKAAKLESDKAFSRKLMKKYGIKALPRFEVFDDVNNAIEYAKSLDWKVAVKPIGLTEGLGVKVYEDQLKNKHEVIDYIYRIFKEKIGGKAKVLIEEKLEGAEFTIQCFVNGNNIISTPAVQDFKKLLSGDIGPNTASMGSYSDKGLILPFMKYDDYLKASDIIMKTLEAFNKETGERCCGFLYGQFMLTSDGIKLIEYNFRPGDPEWMNILSVMEDNVVDIVRFFLDGIQKPIDFEDKATVCKYIVPEGYPKKLNKVLDVTFDDEEIKKTGVDFYYSSGFDNNGKLRVGCERGIAFIAKADTIFEANQMVEKAISMVNGNFHYRKDIGTKQLINSKIEQAQEVRK
jgi:phosphoribosylamine--glycine ligase